MLVETSDAPVGQRRARRARQYDLALNNQHRSAIIAAGGIADLQAALEVHTITSMIRDAITKALQRLGAASP